MRDDAGVDLLYIKQDIIEEDVARDEETTTDGSKNSFGTRLRNNSASKELFIDT